MITPRAHVLAALRFLVRVRPARVGRVRTTAHRARAAVVSGAGALLLLTVCLEVAAETVKPEWRDPEFGHRLRQVKRWQRRCPDRPLVVVVGSSRAQMCVSPHDLGLPNEPDSPLVFNFGYCQAPPLGVWLQVSRLLDAGVKPAAVLVMISAFEHKTGGGAEDEFPHWGPRLSSADLHRLAPYTNDSTAFRRAVFEARCNPLSARREALVSDLLPRWQSDFLRNAHREWEEMDPYGFTPVDGTYCTDETRRRGLQRTRAHHTAAFDGCPVGATSDRALRDLVGRCRTERIAVAAVWAPESPAYCALYTQAGRTVTADYTRSLTTDLGLRVFPAPEHLAEEDFVDGIHLVRDGAARYSRWLADTHLKPWLARVLK
jgi:hypothetical protein